MKYIKMVTKHYLTRFIRESLLRFYLRKTVLQSCEIMTFEFWQQGTFSVQASGNCFSFCPLTN